MTANLFYVAAGLFLVLLMAFCLVYLYMRPTLNTFWVRKHGIRITATVMGTETDINLMGRDTAYYLLARWEDPRTHRVYTFRSDPGGAQLLENHPYKSTVEVLIDPRHPNRYEMVMQLDEHAYIYKTL
ncbi:MAG TPA: hypothetical protein VFB12_23630 [Ktedonobacteraceae bacterium]|nr:hypothetical protein [Ktedonobacteraceae bacterium]